jgi:hypothetical protein
MEKLAKALARLVGKGFPPNFVYVYDEFWQIFRNVSTLMKPLLGDMIRLTTNLWAWFIPANSDGAGFAPHRDIVNAPAMRIDGAPLMITTWIPLRDVTTLNACMYVLPIDKDPNYENNRECVDIPQESIQGIRALPGKAGSVMSWNMNTIHWGSSSSEWADGPRISIAAYLVSADGPNFTSISMDPAQMLTLDFRLGVIGMMMSWFDKAELDKDHYPPQLMEFCDRYFHCETNERRFEQATSGQKPEAGIQMPEAVPRVGRNEPCPCGSGKKYKHCHG